MTWDSDKCKNWATGDEPPSQQAFDNVLRVYLALRFQHKYRELLSVLDAIHDEHPEIVLRERPDFENELRLELLRK